MKKFFSLTLTLAAMLSAMAVSAQAADYSFETDGTPEYYPSSSYEDVYGSRYNYGEKNVVDYQIPKLEYGQLSTTQTGVKSCCLVFRASLHPAAAFTEFLPAAELWRSPVFCRAAPHLLLRCPLSQS